jgi:hypothetical protein
MEWGSSFMSELNSKYFCLMLAPLAGHIVGMHDSSTTQLRQAVRDELEQALYSLPRVSAEDERVALLIEKAVEIATKMELSPPASGDRVPSSEKPLRS